MPAATVDDLLCGTCGHTIDDHKIKTGDKELSSVGCLQMTLTNGKHPIFCQCAAFVDKKPAPVIDWMCECGHAASKHKIDDGSWASQGCLHMAELSGDFCHCKEFHLTDSLKSGPPISMITKSGKKPWASALGADYDNTFIAAKATGTGKSYIMSDMMLKYNYAPPPAIHDKFNSAETNSAKAFLANEGIPSITIAGFRLEHIILSYYEKYAEELTQKRITKALDQQLHERRARIAPIMRKNDRKFRNP